MPKHILTAAFSLLLLALLPLAALSQPDDSRFQHRCFGVFDLCGYVDRQTQKTLIPAQYENAFEFSGGMAAVRIDGKYGYIDRNGTIVIEPAFDLAGAFHAGLAEVLIGNHTGVIDTSGRIVVAPQFARAIPFTSETLIVAEGTYKNKRISGYERLEGLDSPVAIMGRKPFGLYHISDGWVTQQKYKFSAFDDPARGLIWAATTNSRNGPFGLLRADGTWQVVPTYSHVQTLNDGRAVVRGQKQGNRFMHRNRPVAPSGAVDQDGTLVVPLTFNFLSYWRNGYGLATKDDRVGLVAPNGELLGGQYFEKVERPSDGLLPRVRDNDTWFSIQRDGTLIPDEKDGTLLLSCPSGLQAHMRSGMVAFSHPNLTAPIKTLFDLRSITSYSKCSRPISVSANGKFGFVSQSGKLIPNPTLFDDLYGFVNGFAAVKQNGLWGIIDTTGAFTVPPTYQKLRSKNHVFRAVLNDQTLWIDHTGEPADPPTVDQVDRANLLKCKGDARLFAQDDLWGLVDAGGTELIAPKYRVLSCFSKGIAWSVSQTGTQWCPLGPDGAQRTNTPCKDIYYPYYQTHHFPEKFSNDPFENSFLWNKAFLDYGRGVGETLPVWVSDGVQGNVSSTIIRQ